MAATGSGSSGSAGTSGAMPVAEQSPAPGTIFDAGGLVKRRAGRLGGRRSVTVVSVTVVSVTVVSATVVVSDVAPSSSPHPTTIPRPATTTSTAPPRHDLRMRRKLPGLAMSSDQRIWQLTVSVSITCDGGGTWTLARAAPEPSPHERLLRRLGVPELGDDPAGGRRPARVDQEPGRVVTLPGPVDAQLGVDRPVLVGTDAVEHEDRCRRPLLSPSRRAPGSILHRRPSGSRLGAAIHWYRDPRFAGGGASSAATASGCVLRARPGTELRNPDRLEAPTDVRLRDPAARAQGDRREELAGARGPARTRRAQGPPVRRRAVRQLPVLPRPERRHLVLLAPEAADPRRRPSGGASGGRRSEE